MIVRPHSVLLDSEALSSLAAGERRMQAWAAVARSTGSPIYASTVTLTEVTDGSPGDAAVRQAVKGVILREPTAEVGYRAGALRAQVASSRRKARNLTIDALVAATALTLRGPVVILTSDEEDFRLLLTDKHIRVERI